jgi:hypothetical protein
MAFSLGLPAVAAATHKHEFSTFRETIMDRQHSFLHPLQFLNNQLSALSTFSYGSPQGTPAIDTDAAVSESEEQEEPKVQEDDRTQEENGSPRSPCRSKRKAARNPTTSFQLAHPPPTPKHKQRFKPRSRVLLQLRQISKTHSPLPTLEVLPSAPFSHRLSKFCPLGRSRRIVLGADDLVIVNSQMHSPGDREVKFDDDSEEEGGQNQDIVAVISPPGKGDHEPKDHAHIWFDGQAPWVATAMTNGGYEFVSYDEHGLKTTARWVPKTSKRRRGDSDLSKNSSIDDENDKSFKFSVLNPLARRHPVVGSMDRYSINVVDRYATPSTPSMTPTMNTPRSVTPSSPQQSYFSEDAARSQSIYETDDRLRILILVTGIWVAFVEGWSKYSMDHGNSTSTVSSNSPWVQRSGSGRFEHGNRSSAGTPQSATSSHSRAFSLLHRPVSTSSPPITQRPSKLQRRASSSGSSPSRRTAGYGTSYLEARTDTALLPRPAVNSNASRRRHSALPVRTQQSLQPALEESRQPTQILHQTSDEEEEEEEEEEEQVDEMARRNRGTAEQPAHVEQRFFAAHPFVNDHTKANSKKQGKIGRLFSIIGRKKKREK